MPPSAPPNQGTPTRGLAHFPTSRIVGHIDSSFQLYAVPYWQKETALFMQITAIRTALRVIFGLSVSLLVTGITRGTRNVAGVSGNANITTDHSYVRPLLPLRSGVWPARHRRSVAIALLLALGLSTAHFPLTDGRARAASVGVTIGTTTVSAGTVAPGRFVDLSSSIRTNANLQGAVVDYYIVDSSGHTVTQLVDNPVSFSANIPQTISQRWVVPSGQAAASYTFKIGIFGQNWSPLMAWNDQAGSVTIMAFNPTNTATALPTSTPPALPTSTPPALPTNTATALPTNTATALPTNTATALPTNTATALPTNTATALPTNTVSQTGNANGSYISHTGTQLTLNGSPLRVTGYNYTWMGTNCSDPSDAELDAAFAAIQNASRDTIVRTAFYQSASNNGSFADFDRYVAAAKHYGLRIVPMLINEWTDCEPSSRMKYLPWYQTGYTQANDGYPLSFHDYAVRLAAHYANEPAIAWWQLVNEPDARNVDNSCSESIAASALRAFADTMTDAIKAADPHHMVDLGAVSWCGGQGNDYQLINAGKTDLCDAYHDYGSPTTPMPSHLQNHLNACHSDNKPAFVGEAGICADVTTTGSCGGTVTAASLTQRASLFKAKMDAAFTAGAAGYIIWEQGTSSVGWGVGPGDPTKGVMAAS